MNLRRKIFEYIVHFQDEMGCLPSQNHVRECFSGLTDDVDMHLEQLEREGLLRLDQKAGELSMEPVLGAVPKLFLRNHAPPDSPDARRGEGSRSIVLDLREIGMPMEEGAFALYVADDSMSDAGIWGGDIAIMSNAPAARGDIIAVEEDDRLVLRRYLIIRQIPHTLAENPRRPDLRHAVLRETCGVLWGLIRRQIGCHPARYQPRKRYSYSRDSLVPGSNKISSYEHSVSSSGRDAGNSHSYSREAFLIRPAEPPFTDRIDSKPWDSIDTLHPKAARKTKCQSETGKRGKIRGTRIGTKLYGPGTDLPQPPDNIGLNEAKPSDYPPRQSS